ncbi:hypothetical protein BVC80_8997g20 [Macleaya cordata]|uniref:Uncharacterized protein n=1 Tax=Macleaya cordata TaxID=56857 RepID=A0A200QMJ0_MACCD|nr:hypothetical protein BVC80_8997g20 [Macleaya cordata]
MKFFLLDFVTSCYRPSSQSPHMAVQPSPSSFLLEEEIRANSKPLSYAGGEDDHNPPPSKKRGKKKVVVTRSHSMSSASQWKPSLTAISEDDKVVVTVVSKSSSERRTVRSDGKVAGKSGSKARIRASDYHHNHRDNNEYRLARSIVNFSLYFGDGPSIERTPKSKSTCTHVRC